MEPLLLLVHRIPYPPNKGDKVRSWNLLRFLARRYEVHLGTFADTEDDLDHVDVLRGVCASVCVRRIRPRLARLASVRGLATGEPLSLPYYRSAALAAWAADTVRRHAIRKCIVFSSPMAQYVRALPLERCLVDFVDVDSDKWRQYAETRPWPQSWIYGREARLLSEFEGRVAAAAVASVFVTPAEAELFRAAHPELAPSVHAVANGVDSEYFAPVSGRPSPFASGERAIVFTGAMDYWPNIDAVSWFAREVLPGVVEKVPTAKFHIVGSRPSRQVHELGLAPTVRVHADVPDVRPYLQHAALVVAPMRLGRGIQNKVLEAMSMGRPTLVSSVCLPSLTARPGEEIGVARSAGAFAAEAVRLLTGDHTALGERARERVVSDYAWERNLTRFVTLLEGEGPVAGQPDRGGPRALASRETATQ